MIFMISCKQLGTKIMNNEKYSFYLNEVRKNLAASFDRSPLIAIFPLIFVPSMQYTG